MPEPLDVRSLICHRDVPLALRCLPSLLTYSHEPLRLTLHDDGSLTDVDEAALLNTFPGARIIRRAEADRVMEDILRQHPACAEFRRVHPLAVKLFDTALGSGSSLLRYCDTDVLFFRPFRGLFDLSSDVDAIFMTDTHDAYSLRSWQMLRRGVRLVARLNSGLICFRVDRFDLDRVEWFLKQQMDPRFPHFAEQTAWAVLAAPLVTRQWDPKQVRIIAGGVRRPVTLVAGHYVGPFRDLLNEVRDDDRAPLSDQPVPLSTRPTTTIGPLQLAIREGRRWVGRHFGRSPEPGHDAYAGEP